MRLACLLLALLVASGATAQPGGGLDALLAPEADMASGATLSDSATVSLLTMLPGEEVYSKWGHSAFRIHDPATGLDKTYNYGTFDFNQPGFIVRFLRGHLDYILDTAPFEVEVYKYRDLYERSMIEQVLNVSPQTVRELYAALEVNALPENRAYRYDFVYDNCSTRLVDMLDAALTASGEAPAVTLAPPTLSADGDPRTFREILDPYTEGSPWLHFGVRLGIGVPADQEATARQATFLPLDLMTAFDDASVDGSPLVTARDTVFWIPPPPEAAFPWPLALGWALFAFAIGATFWMRRHLRSDRLRRWGARFDAFLFFLAGFGGVVLLLMWFASDHIVTEANLELLWLWPTHLIAAFGFARLGLSGLWRRYATVTAIATLLVVLLWWLWPEPMHPAGIPLALLLAFRSGVRAFLPDV